ncbi:MAG: glycosyltransferase [Polyangiaceae bacterium]|nr:glycosyltransferase [Polyangiaceae bacterium]
MNIALCVLYFGVLALLSGYGLHRLHLVVLCRIHRKRLQAIVDSAPYVAERSDEKLPRVTIQLPLFNESTVTNRLLDAIAKMDYPASRLEIQVLDDSTDETQAIAHAHVERLRAQGVDAVYLHRVDRTGYKAGALDNGLKVAKGDLVAVFDADFVPQPDFVRSIVGHFDDPKVAMVQTRWGHMNRDHSNLTQIQALMLDGHHLVENRARCGAGFLFNFSGTGGMWRRQAIEDAGGWEHDTLTEDLDLSYRAQLKGWKFVYRPDVVTPSELPEEVSAVRAQQYRWAKGTVQTARKLMGRVLRSDLTLSQRVEAFFHLTPHFAYPLMVMLSVLLLPAMILMPAASSLTMFLVDLPLLTATTGSLAAFYMEAERAQGRRSVRAAMRLPMLIALGTGLAPHLTKAVFDGVKNMAGEFVRTPKQGTNKARYKVYANMPWLEIGLALLSFGSVVASITSGHWFATPFAMLFMSGYAYVAVLVATEQKGRKVVTPVSSETVSDAPPALASDETAAAAN